MDTLSEYKSPMYFAILCVYKGVVPQQSQSQSEEPSLNSKRKSQNSSPAESSNSRGSNPKARLFKYVDSGSASAGSHASL